MEDSELRFVHSSDQWLAALRDAMQDWLAEERAQRKADIEKVVADTNAALAKQVADVTAVLKAFNEQLIRLAEGNAVNSRAVIALAEQMTAGVEMIAAKQEVLNAQMGTMTLALKGR